MLTLLASGKISFGGFMLTKCEFLDCLRQLHFSASQKSIIWLTSLWFLLSFLQLNFYKETANAQRDF